MSDSLGIISLDALSMPKDDYKKRCFTIWKQFTDFCGEDYDEFPPGEGALYGYFKSLREDKNMASSSIWHHYSCINTVVKNRIYLYSFLYVFTIKLTVIKYITQRSCSLL